MALDQRPFLGAFFWVFFPPCCWVDVPLEEVFSFGGVSAFLLLSDGLLG